MSGRLSLVLENDLALDLLGEEVDKTVRGGGQRPSRSEKGRQFCVYAVTTAAA